MMACYLIETNCVFDFVINGQILFTSLASFVIADFCMLWSDLKIHPFTVDKKIKKIK